MSDNTISTTDLNKKLRLVLSNEFILGHLDVKPAVVVKGNPRWSPENCSEICTMLELHFKREAATFKILAAQKPKKPPVVVDDDDDL